MAAGSMMSPTQVIRSRARDRFLGAVPVGVAHSRPDRRGEPVATDASFRLGDLEPVTLRRRSTQTFQVPINRGADFKSEVKFSLRSPREVKGGTFTRAD